jgi:hypothetical protein
MFREFRLFQKVATGVLIIFMGLMVLVTIAAYTRSSGTTRQDMSEARFIRQSEHVKAKV